MPWACGTCTVLNDNDSFLQCFVCAAPRPAKRKAPDDNQGASKRAAIDLCDSDDEVMPAKKVRGSPEGTEKLKAEPLIEQEFALGVRVEAKWNGRYYPASVHRFDKGRYEVMWDDDEGYNWVPAKALRAAK